MNNHVHPVMRDVLNAFALTQPLRLDAERSAELQAERRFEWKADAREAREAEQAEREGGAE